MDQIAFEISMIDIPGSVFNKSFTKDNVRSEAEQKNHVQLVFSTPKSC